MIKKIDDIIPKKEKNFNKIPIDFNVEKKEEKLSGFSHFDFKEKDFSEEIKNLEKEIGEKKTKINRRIWTLAILSFLFLLFSSSFLFSKAKVIIVPRKENFSINNQFFAERQSFSNLSYELITVSESVEGTVKATKSIDVEKKARGKVIIFNNFSSTPLKLVAGTRLESIQGKIYKLEKNVTIPGAKIEDGELIPGSIEGDIIAEFAGEEYNNEPTDFTFPSFKGSPKYKKIFARSQGNIEGGFKGKMNIVDEEEARKIKANLDFELEEKLKKLISQQVPSDFIYWPDGVIIEINKEISSFETQVDSLTIISEGKASAIVFKKEDLIKKILSQALGLETREEGDYQVEGIEKLNFVLRDKNQFIPGKTNGINFILKGDLKITWPVNHFKLITNLIGQDKKDFRKILANFDNIDQGKLILIPFWRSTLPEKEDRIQIEIKNN